MRGRSRRHASPRSTSPGQPRPGSSPLNLAFIAIPALAVLSIGLWAAGILSPASKAPDDNEVARIPAADVSRGVLPDFVTAGGPDVREAYGFALAASADLEYIPCYCGCGEHSGHRSVRDCFLKSVSAEGVTFDEHGANCNICVSIVLDVKRLLAEGRSLAEVRAFIDETYAGVGSGTDTPLPPGTGVVAP